MKIGPEIQQKIVTDFYFASGSRFGLKILNFSSDFFFEIFCQKYFEIFEIFLHDAPPIAAVLGPPHEKNVIDKLQSKRSKILLQNKHRQKRLREKSSFTFSANKRLNII